ncbi:hypothetical protein Pint_03151 [Pistacia integerrima]|uniref:Uncharacterized protein n=1 Tax=Pistacia integerrima TaxID=434235 RepID=A0ACC0ZPY2_9ROSI|nr:hypothetical protein Pint_03151 [Pistacia integerrima]
MDSSWVYFLIGSCNGLLYLGINLEYRVVFVFNPSTGEFKKVQCAAPPHNLLEGIALYGFGYVQSLDDYKFVEFSYFDEEVCLNIFSPRNNTRKSVPFDPPLTLQDYKQLSNATTGTPLNGTIRWACYSVIINSCSIVALIWKH